jgi:hypothetical protein
MNVKRWRGDNEQPTQLRGYYVNRCLGTDDTRLEGRLRKPGTERRNWSVLGGSRQSGTPRDLAVQQLLKRSHGSGLVGIKRVRMLVEPREPKETELNVAGSA